MEMRPEPKGPGPLVTGFAGGGYRVRDGAEETIFPAGLMLTPDAAVEWDVPAFDAAALAPLLDREPPPEFLLLGTGATLEQPPRTFVSAIEARGIGVEAMDSRAAARAWGVLRAEGREIVAALMPL